MDSQVISRFCLFVCLHGVGGVEGLLYFFMSALDGHPSFRRWFQSLSSQELPAHPLLSTDYGQMEIINQVLESHLCYYVS